MIGIIMGIVWGFMIGGSVASWVHTSRCPRCASMTVGEFLDRTPRPRSS